MPLPYAGDRFAIAQAQRHIADALRDLGLADEARRALELADTIARHAREDDTARIDLPQEKTR